MNNHLTKAIFKMFEQDSSSHTFLNSLLMDATVYLFGGAVRDFLDGKLESARDIDFMVESRE